MNQIICPHCEKEFTIDKASYAEIQNQVRSKEFDKEIHEKLEQANLQHKKDLAIKDANAKKVLADELAKQELKMSKMQGEIDNFSAEKELAKKEVEEAMTLKIIDQEKLIEKLSTEKQLEVERLTATKNKELVEMQNKLATFDNAKKLELAEIIAKKDHELHILQSKINMFDNEKELVKKDVQSEMQEEINKLKAVNVKLENEVVAVENKKNLEMTEKLASKERDLADLSSKLELAGKENAIEVNSVKQQYEVQLKQKDEEIAIYKDFKARQNVKLLGESLEQHCEVAFNSLRMTAFPRAFFGKDNDVTSGTKGDYIYREFDENDVEVISIMFEMKNEADTTATKKKNEDFFAKLDKDRNDKKCEYAIMVSMLEQENEFYNNGIVDVSYTYSKMYVIRPQFFIPIITLLRNAALNSLVYKNEVELMRQQNIDITNFEAELDAFRTSFNKSYNWASDRFKDAITGIDKTMAQLQKTRDALIKSEDHLRIANDKAENMTIKKLVKNNPTMKDKFAELSVSD